MPPTVIPVTEADLPTFRDIELAAFRSHPRMAMLWPKGHTPAMLAFSLERKRTSFHDPESRFMQAVDDATGTVLAGSQWTFALDPDANAAKPVAESDEAPPASWPVEGNWAMSLFFKREWQMYLKQTFGRKAYVEAQRQGAGTALMTWGVRQADALGLPMCLESTPAGLGLYKRFGFKEVRELRADMREFGWNKPYDEDAAVRFWMMREPSAVCQG
nr:hypothetical protein CFP56_21932 [Quercus suber]